MGKNISGKQNPLYRGDKPLEFDDLTEDDLLELDDKQKVDRFMSNWMDKTHPFSKYKNYFESSTLDQSRILRDIKLFFKKFVVEDEWDEKEYVMILDYLMSDFKFINSKNFLEGKKLYENKQLPIQIKMSKVRSRRGRI